MFFFRDNQGSSYFLQIQYGTIGILTHILHFTEDMLIAFGYFYFNILQLTIILDNYRCYEIFVYLHIYFNFDAKLAIICELYFRKVYNLFSCIKSMPPATVEADGGIGWD